MAGQQRDVMSKQREFAVAALLTVAEAVAALAAAPLTVQRFLRKRISEPMWLTCVLVVVCVCVQCDSYFLTYLAAGATPQALSLPPPPTGKVRRIIRCIDKNRMSSLELCAAYCCVLHPHSSLCAHLHFRVVSELIALCPQTA